MGALGNRMRSLTDFRASYELYLQQQIAANTPQQIINYNDWLHINSPTFCWDWYYTQSIIKYLDAIERGDIKRLMLFCPPRHGKSELVTIRYPAYTISKDPSKRIILGAYNQTLSEKFSRRCKAVATNCGVILNPERQAVADWETLALGGLRAVGVGGGITGMGGHGIIIDDPVKSREEANSEAYRERVWNWFTDDLFTRLEPNGWMILIMTRWHEDDLAGRILASEFANDWVVVKYPAIAEINDPLGRQPGEALCNDRYPVEELEKIRIVLGRNFDALYQQRPSALEGNIFNPKDFIEFEKNPQYSFHIQVWDTAFKENEQNDYSVGLKIKCSKDGFYLVDRKKGKWNFTQLRHEIEDWNKLDPANAILVEDAASGQSIVQAIKSETDLPIIGIPPRKFGTDKVARANACADSVISGRWHIPKYASWKADFLANLSQFPNATHDDDVDAFTIGANYLIHRFANSFPIYQDFGDLHVTEYQKIQGAFVRVYIASYIDTMACAVCVAVTEYGQIVVLDEFVSISGVEDLVFNQLKEYAKQAFPNTFITHVVFTERTDNYWQSVFADAHIEPSIIGTPPFDERCELVRERLNRNIRKRPALQCCNDTCNKLIEGFRGAYSYKARSDSDAIDYQPTPVLNVYSRLHNALHAAVYQYEIERDEITRED